MSRKPTARNRVEPPLTRTKVTAKAKAAPAKPKRTKPAKVRRLGFVERSLRALVRATIRLLWLVGSRVAMVGALILASATGWFYLDLPPVAELLDKRARGSVTLLDRDGSVFAWRGDQFGGTLRSTEISPHLLNAIIATEDKRFYSHYGVDPRGIARAMYQNIQAGRLVQGGSTLTQQTAKVVFLENARTLERKIKEIPIALAMELKYEKADILSIYLNRVYLGAGTHGFEAAAQRYFGKSAREVGPAEAAMLAGLLKAPSRYAPTSDLTRAQGRAKVIIGLMHDQGYLNDEQAEIALKDPARLSTAAAARAGGYFADWMMESGPAYLTRETSEDVAIHTTFDPRIQRAAEAALTEVFKTKVKEGSKAQAAIVVLSPDGAVRAIVGGREITPQAGQFNRATQALRQTGSVFKPVVYAAALAAGKHPLDIVQDAPLTLNVPGSGRWSPRNYTKRYLGEITLTEALSKSINTAAVRVSEDVGADRVRDMARLLGMHSPLAKGPAIALGTSEATLLEMSGVFATILNSGTVASPYGVREIRLRSSDEMLMGTESAEETEALPPEVARQLIGMLRSVVTDGTGTRASLETREVAGKTGTTQAARDAWFIGFSADYIVGVWMGYDDNSPLTGVTGGGLPAEIFRLTMSRIHDGVPVKPLPMAIPTRVPATTVTARSETPRSEPSNTDSIVQQILRDVIGNLARAEPASEERIRADQRARDATDR